MKIEIPNTNKIIGEGQPVFVIAEIGKNFIQTEKDRPVEEYLENAKKLVDAAVEAGADAVKFQTHCIIDEQLDVNVVSPHFRGADRYSWIMRNEKATPLAEFWLPLKRYCDKKGIIFFSTPMSRKAAEKLDKIGVPFWKVGSGDAQDYATLDFMIETKKPIIISTGMVGLKELDEVIRHITGKGSPMAVLYCVSQYPAPPEYFNLSTIEYLKEKYPNVVIGFSDHSLGDEISLAAVRLGAKIIEKHFSFSCELWGADHKVSMTPEEFKKMVDKIRGKEYKNIDSKPYYGTKEKELEGANNKFRPYFNKSLMAGKDIPAGTILTKDMIYAMRPKMYAGGLDANRFYDVIGKKTTKNIKRYEPIAKDIVGELPLLPTPSFRRKICFIITSFIHYSRSLLILEELKNRSDVELHIIIGGSAVLPKYASKYLDISHYLKEGGFKNIHEIYFNLEGSKGVTKAKSTGLGVVEFSSMYQKIKPDLVVVRADRFEVLAATLAAAYMNIPVAHIEGGDLSGTLDESVRHAITKLSHIHFATNEPAKRRILKMGEDPKYVFNFGSPDIEIVQKLANDKNAKIDWAQTGSGADFDFEKGFLMVMYHPVTTELEKIPEKAKDLLEVVHGLDLPTLWFWPNFDAGAEEISHELRIFKDKVRDHKIKFMRFLPPQKFLSLLKNTLCLIGNSSAGIKECSFLGIPVVNIGSRQNNRLRGENVFDANHNKEEIRNAIIAQLSAGRYEPADIYHANDTSKEIAKVLAENNLYVQKKFCE